MTAPQTYINKHTHNFAKCSLKTVSMINNWTKFFRLPVFGLIIIKQEQLNKCFIVRRRNTQDNGHDESYKLCYFTQTAVFQHSSITAKQIMSVRVLVFV